MTTASLHYLSAADAARDLDPDNYWPAYTTIYTLLTSGGIEGAYLTGRRWIIPVEGIRAAGIEISGKGAVEIEPVRTRKVPAPYVDIDFDEIPEILDEEPTLDPSSDVADALSLISREIARLRADNARLQAERDAARDRANDAEAHLRDLRSILDYATSPSQNR